ncbi:alpha/beta hydrolase [Spirulina sp. CS-785/01]|uniref:alpha/beta hydrolase n=1 Tax=Spirulina sp. CS-785/01 TaxID=3021716 RepID=UPI00232C9C19|nr:alpha/beta hydrolase [Spirulina sp. CS-785/01]MDB9314686.1 alpha/beta hydrolase [Spirulina sp. CS-785/01]
MNGVWFVQWLILALSGVGMFFSLWIIIPAPIFALLSLEIGVRELSPGLVGFNALLLLLSRFSPFPLLTLICSGLGFLFSLLPLLQFYPTHKRFTRTIEEALGSDALQAIPPEKQAQMRPKPFILQDIFRGIPLPPVRIEREIPFACPDGVQLTLNCYRPLTEGKYPTLIMIYGGAWRQGTPRKNEAFSCYFAHQGYTILAISYRHTPTYRFPAQIEDVQTALQYIRNHGEELGVDLNRVVIMGRSAGGHLAMLAGYTESPIQVRAVINYYAPVNLTNGYYDLPFPDPLDTRAVLRDLLGGTPEEFPELYKQASPWHYLQADLPPSLLVYTAQDHLVLGKFGRHLYKRLRGDKNLAVFLEVPWAEHAFDAVFCGISNQLVLYHTERFLAWALLD